MFATSLWGQELSEHEVINRARATIGNDAALDGLVTMELVGSLEPANTNMPSATLLIVARKPLSQRLEIKVDDIVETTILDGNRGCIIRSNLNAEASQMRDLIGPELERVTYSTRQFFNFYRPDFSNGEKVSLVGTETYRDTRCYKLLYEYPGGPKTVRYFSVAEDTLVSTITENGVESIGVGSQTVGGIKFPKAIEYYESGRKLHTIFLHEIKVNKPLTVGIFDIPEGDTQ
ncbi:hypothetical protein QEH59_04760 [Coraliomargarita sp. SDUM461004]|uniref:Outer membrane lipoprotein-sorting protein n=1 Tax=Thalassobacterium sedimentorum TaxID=3041258 RepID=A0ABU1AFW6_9BACT|nr:hypothetical protein [Coraliomargarita sp. SDUM461004]MDQ8193721.1 hypothetical protein [Coraliomargarita sp. SDUM461004]